MPISSRARRKPTKAAQAVSLRQAISDHARDMEEPLNAMTDLLGALSLVGFGLNSTHGKDAGYPVLAVAILTHLRNLREKWCSISDATDERP